MRGVFTFSHAKWTLSEDVIVETHPPYWAWYKLQKHRTYAAVIKRRGKLGIAKPLNTIKRDDWTARYQAGESISEIAESCKCSFQLVWSDLIKRGIRIKGAAH